MVCFENAKVLSAEELKELIDEEYTNPTVERMMFIETKDKGEIPGKVFPCYLEAWGEDEKAKVGIDPGLRFQICIMQSMGGEFGLLRVVIYAKELGTNKRIWDKPPTKHRRDDTPWVTVSTAAEVQ